MVSSQNYVFRKKQNRCAKVIAAGFFFVLMHACRLTYVLVYTDTLLCTRYIYIYMYIYIGVEYIYMYTCIWIHYIYIIHIDTHANRHIGKELRSFDFGPGLSPFG